MKKKSFLAILLVGAMLVGQTAFAYEDAEDIEASTPVVEEPVALPAEEPAVPPTEEVEEISEELPVYDEKEDVVTQDDSEASYYTVDPEANDVAVEEKEDGLEEEKEDCCEEDEEDEEEKKRRATHGDVLALYRYLSGRGGLTAEQREWLDVNKDGVINVLDLAEVRRLAGSGGYLFLSEDSREDGLQGRRFGSEE